MDAASEIPAAPSRFSGAVRAVVRNLGWLLASRGVLAVLSLFYLGFATRSLGVVDFGRFALITGAAQALATLVAFQTWQIIVQYGIGPAQAGDEARLARLFRACGLLDLGSAVVGAVLAVVILTVWGKSFGIEPDLMDDTLIFTLAQLVTIRSTPLGILRLRDRFGYSALADSMTPVVRFVAALGAMLFHPTVEAFLLGWAAAEVVTAAVYWWLVAKTGDLKLLFQGKATVAQVAEENPGLLRFALSTNASATLGLSSKQLPLLVVGAALGPAPAGVFRLAGQIAQALAKLSQLVSRAAFPEVVRAVRDAKPEALRRIIVRMFVASVATGAAILLILSVIGRPALRLIGGPGFSHAFTVLMLMAAAGCVELTTVGLETMMTARRRAGTVFLVRAVSVALLFGVAWPLLSDRGVIGMAIAVLLAAFAAALGLGVATWRRVARDVRRGSGASGTIARS